MWFCNMVDVTNYDVVELHGNGMVEKCDVSAVEGEYTHPGETEVVTPDMDNWEG
jgi:hypothetical protein